MCIRDREKERDAVEKGSVSARNLVFVDTSAFKAYYDRKDRHHKAARNFVARVVEREIEFRLLVTSDYVLDETATLVKRAVGAKEASRFLRAVQDSKMIRVVHVGKEYFEKAKQLFEKHSDTEWSFTDCTSFTLMKELGIKHAFTFDEHFKQAGFTTHPLAEKR